MTESKVIFSKKLRALLDKKNITQVELSKILGVSESTVGKWLLQKSMPRMTIIEKLASYFQVDKTYFFNDNDSKLPDEKDLPELTAKDEREIESDLEDMMHSVASASCEGDDDFEDIEAFKAAVKVAMVQAKRIAKKKYTPKKYRKE